jgi:hypothetical protein
MLETSDFRNLQYGTPCHGHGLHNAAVTTACLIQHMTVLVTTYCWNPLCLKGLNKSTEHLGPLKKRPGWVLNWYLPQQKSVSLNQSSVSQGKQIVCISERPYGTNSVRRGQNVLRQKWQTEPQDVQIDAPYHTALQLRLLVPTETCSRNDGNSLCLCILVPSEPVFKYTCAL